MAEIIHRAEDLSNIEITSVSYESMGANIPAFLAKPMTKGPFPALIIGQEAFGLTKHIEDIAANMAAEGYVALVPDYYSRTGPPNPKEDIPTIKQAIDRLDNENTLKDFKQGINYLLKHDLARDGQIGTLGFCTGGTYSLILAIELMDLRCAAMFYISQLEYVELNVRKPYHPMERAGNIKCPTFIGYGTNDKVGTPERLGRLEANLRNGQVPYTLNLYEGGDHGFLNPDGWNYLEKAARQAWPDLLDFLRTHLKS